jgi:hypothetical protein
MITDDDLRGFWQSDEGKRLHEKFLHLQPAVDRMVYAIRRSETLGHFGWAFPVDMQPREYVAIAEESSSSDKADAAFLRYYTRSDGLAYRRLISVLINEPDLRGGKALLKEIKQSYDDGRYRVCVTGLLPVLDHIAQKTWDAPLNEGSNARKSIDRKIGVIPDSFTDHFWRSVKAFVDDVFVPAKKSKPHMLNRHWILHGRGVADGSQIDCLRLLQAIRTLQQLVKIGKKAKKAREDA